MYRKTYTPMPPPTKTSLPQRILALLSAHGGWLPAIPAVVFLLPTVCTTLSATALGGQLFQYLESREEKRAEARTCGAFLFGVAGAIVGLFTQSSMMHEETWQAFWMWWL